MVKRTMKKMCRLSPGSQKKLAEKTKETPSLAIKNQEETIGQKILNRGKKLRLSLEIHRRKIKAQENLGLKIIEIKTTRIKVKTLKVKKGRHPTVYGKALQVFPYARDVLLSLSEFSNF